MSDSKDIRELEKLRAYAREASIALMELSGGGSEMFKRIGDEFYAEPDLCVRRARENMETIARICAHHLGAEGGRPLDMPDPAISEQQSMIKEVERLRELRRLSERATEGPWCWEQCGEKEDAPVIGTASLHDDENCNLVEGRLRDFDDEGGEINYCRHDRICSDMGGRSPSADAAFIVACVNFVRAALNQEEPR